MRLLAELERQRYIVIQHNLQYTYTVEDMSVTSFGNINDI